MKTELKISSGFQGVLPTGSYSNMRPSFSAEITYSFDGTDVEGEIKKQQTMLQDICFKKFQAIAEQARIDLVKSQKANIRFHTIKDEEGKEIQVPSVSSIASFDVDLPDMPEHELQQYASQGNLADLQCRHYLSTGAWETDLVKIPETFTDLRVLSNGNLKLEPLIFNFPAFVEKFKVSGMVEGKFCSSLKHKFAGTPDIQVLIMDGKKYLADWKRTPVKGHFRQLAGYVIAIKEMYPDEAPFDGLMLIGVKSDTAQGFSKPMISTEVAQWEAAFLKARENFKKLFLI